MDDFHRPGHKFRSMREEWTPQSYYDEGYDYVAFRDLVLRPLARVATAVFARPCLTRFATRQCHRIGRQCPKTLY